MPNEGKEKMQREEEEEEKNAEQRKKKHGVKMIKKTDASIFILTWTHPWTLDLTEGRL